MHRSKPLKTSIFKPTKGGNYQPPAQLILRAREGDDDDEGEGGQREGEFTPGQVTAVNTIIHKAIGSRLSSQSFKDSIGAIAGEAAGQAMEGFSSKIDELIAAQGKSSEGDDKEDKGNKGKTPDFKDSPEYKAMVQRDKDRQTEHDALIAKDKEKEEAQLRSEERTHLEAALRKAGIEEVKIRACAATLIHEDKVLQRDSAGNIVYRAQRDGYFDDLDLSAGVADYLGTDEGKAFMPASGASGTGSIGNSDNKGQNSQRKGQAQTKDEAAKVVSAWLGGGGVG